MKQADCISDESRFTELQPEWTKLWNSCARRSLFLTHEWFRSCWNEIREFHQLRIVLIRDCGRLVFLAPLMKTRSKSKGFPIDCFTFIEHPESQRQNFLITEGYDQAGLFAEFLTFISEDRSADWNMLSLDKIPAESRTVQSLSDAATSCGWRFETTTSHASLYIHLNRAWESYLGGRSPRFRKTLRNVTNRINQLGRIDVRSYTGREAAMSAFEKLCAVSVSSWKASDGIAITSQPARIQFFQELLAKQGDNVRIWILEADGVPIASETQVIDGSTVYALRADYDERFSAQSPGFYLQYEILKQLFESSYEIYDFGIGVNAYKTRWTQEQQGLLNWRLYNETLYSRLLYSADKYDRLLRRMPGLRALHGFVANRGV